MHQQLNIRGMMPMFFDMIQDTMEVFWMIFPFVVLHLMFDCLISLDALKRCERFRLVLNWEKCHFMV